MLKKWLLYIIWCRGESDEVTQPDQDVNQPRTPSSRFPQLDDDQKEKIVMDTMSPATKKQTEYGVNIFRRRCQI